MKKLVLTGIATLLLSSTVLAGECKFKTVRVACPGKELEALKPYDDKAEVPDTKKATDEADCLKQAKKSSEISRKKMLASEKVHTITFDGKDLGKTFEDKSDCK